MTEQLSSNPGLSLTKLLSAFGPNLEFSKDLAELSSFKTGGKARYFLSVGSASEISKAVKAAKQLQIPCFIIGGGTNLLISDSGFDGLIVKVDVAGLELKAESEIICGAGEQLEALVGFAADKALSGLEFAAGIWGTVGGAIYGNAGAYGGDMAGVVAELKLVNGEGEIKTVNNDYCRFGYRDSYLKKTGEIIVEALFRLQKGEKAVIDKKIDEIMRERDRKFENIGCSAGCFFKNIPDPAQPHGKLSAGRLLEDAGVKQLEVGGAKVFEKHANIIVNKGNATSKDIRRLADIMKEKVKEKFGVELTEEIIQIGDF